MGGACARERKKNGIRGLMDVQKLAKIMTNLIEDLLDDGVVGDVTEFAKDILEVSLRDATRLSLQSILIPYDYRNQLLSLTDFIRLPYPIEDGEALLDDLVPRRFLLVQTTHHLGRKSISPLRYDYDIS